MDVTGEVLYASVSPAVVHAHRTCAPCRCVARVVSLTNGTTRVVTFKETFGEPILFPRTSQITGWSQNKHASSGSTLRKDTPCSRTWSGGRSTASGRGPLARVVVWRTRSRRSRVGRSFPSRSRLGEAREEGAQASSHLRRSASTRSHERVLAGPGGRVARVLRARASVRIPCLTPGRPARRVLRPRHARAGSQGRALTTPSVGGRMVTAQTAGVAGTSRAVAANVTQRDGLHTQGPDHRRSGPCFHWKQRLTERNVP